MNNHFVIELTREEAETAWNAMDYAFEALDGDMALDCDERQELSNLEALKDRIREKLDAEQDTKRTSYGEVLNEQAGHPLEAVDALVRGWRK